MWFYLIILSPRITRIFTNCLFIDFSSPVPIYHTGALRPVLTHPVPSLASREGPPLSRGELPGSIPSTKLFLGLPSRQGTLFERPTTVLSKRWGVSFRKFDVSLIIPKPNISSFQNSIIPPFHYSIIPVFPSTTSLSLRW
jgi:hypothetical protein